MGQLVAVVTGVTVGPEGRCWSTWIITGSGDWLRGTDRNDWRCATLSLWSGSGKGTYMRSAVVLYGSLT